MQASARRYLIISQLGLFIALVICLILIPGYLFARNEGGMSNYGIHLKTIVPYSLGFIIAAGYCLKAAQSLKPKSLITRRLRQLLFSYSTLLLLVLITTYGYKTTALLKNIHITATIVIAYFELIAAGWLCFAILRDKLNIVLLAFQFIGFIIATLTFVGLWHLLFTSQLITIVAFGIILIRGSSSVVEQGS